MFLTGFVLSLCSYLIWGLAPIFWKQVTHIPAEILLYHRVFFAAIILFFILIPSWKSEVKKLRSNLKYFVITSVLIGSNWYIFVWAIVNNRILETSLGYYLNPFVNLIIGYVFLKERLNKKQYMAVLVAFVGVIFITVAVGKLPWVSIVLALTFSLYGFLHKKNPMRADFSLFTETLLLLPIFLTLNFSHAQIPEVYHNPTNILWLFFGGALTVVPLICFIQGVKYIPLSLTGILQFLAPTMTFLIAVFLYNEPFSSLQLLGFGFIWISIAFYVTESFRKRNII